MHTLFCDLGYDPASWLRHSVLPLPLIMLPPLDFQLMDKMERGKNKQTQQINFLCEIMDFVD